MNTIEALNHHWHNSQYKTQAELAKRIGVKPRIVNAWLRDGNMPTAERLVRCQEFLVEQGYEIDELRDLSDTVKELRKRFFKGDITAERMLEVLGYTKVCLVWNFFAGGYTALHKESACRELLAGFAGSQSDPVVESEPQNDFDTELERALDIIVGLGRNMISMGPSGRRDFRQRHPRIFDGSNILAAACSEQAFKTFQTETRP